MRRSTLTALLASAIAFAAAPRDGRAQDLDPDQASALPPDDTAPLTRAVAAGQHWRLDTPRGPVHVWIPDGYDPTTAAIVTYVHGYYTRVDEAWVVHELPEQFALSGINAMFIACEAPAGPRGPVAWRSLRALLAAVRDGTGEPLPPGRLVAVGHSGAFRTLIPWLANPQLDTVVLVDAAYQAEPFRAWILGSRRRRLIDIGEDTTPWADTLHRRLPSTVVVDALPPAEEGALPADAAAARIVYIRSQVGHMPLVTGGVALPMVLRALAVDRLPGAPSMEPLGVLPPRPTSALDSPTVSATADPIAPPSSEPSRL